MSGDMGSKTESAYPKVHRCQLKIQGLRQRAFAPMPEEIRTIWLFTTAFLFPVWILVYSSDTHNWVYGAEQILAGESVYRPLLNGPNNPVPVARYPYTPTFAILTSILIAPFYFLGKFSSAPELVVTGGKLISTGLWAYLGFLTLPILVCHLVDTEKGRFFGGLIFLTLPALWYRVGPSGPELLIGVLVLGTFLAVRRQMWLLAGLLTGLSMFKFTGIPFGGVLAAFSLYYGGRSAFHKVAVGGILSQAPMTVYFLAHPDDFWFVLSRRGAITYYSGDVQGLLLTPVKQLDILPWYTDVGFPIVVMVLTILGAYVSVRRRYLVAGFAISYVSTSMLVPVMEQRLVPLYVLLFLAFVTAWNHLYARISAALLYAIILEQYLVTVLNRGYITNLWTESPLAGIFANTTQIMLLLMIVVIVLYLPPVVSEARDSINYTDA